MADELFNQADLNKDQRIDLNEFRTFIAQNMGLGSVNFAANAPGGGGQYTAGSYESSSSATYGDGNYGGVAELAGATISGAGAAGGEANYSSYEQSSYATASGVNAGGIEASASGGFDIGGFEANASSGIALTNETAGVSSASTFETSSFQQQVQVDAGNPQNLYHDPNPQIIRRPAQGGDVTYTQNVKIRFLQPPPIPPPGPLIIKEVRPPQPPPPPPLRIRQQAPPLPPPPPLILRERPPIPPAAVASQTVIRTLKALPVPPRSVIIERLPPLPPKPRDIIIERWIPYGAAAKRKTIVQRAEAAKEYPKPRNIIIQYEPVQVRIVRQFQRLGVTQENPKAYVQRYGISLLDAQTLVQQARAAGVIEDISPPGNIAAITAGSTSFNAEFTSTSSGIETTGGVGLTTGGDVGTSASTFASSSYSGGQQGNASFSGFESVQGVGQQGNASFSGFESAQGFGQQGNASFPGFESAQGFGQQGNASFSGFESAQGAGQQGNAGFSSFESAQGAGLTGGFSSSYESSSFSSQGGDAALARAEFGGASASGYESYSASAGGISSTDTDPATAAFIAADLNKDGILDINEFRQFLTSQLQYRP